VWVTGGTASEIDQAKQGIYPQVFVDGLRTETLKSYFLRGTGLSAGYCTVKSAIRQRVTFLDAGVDSPPPAGFLDLVVVSLTAEALSMRCRGPFREQLRDRVRAGGLLVVPSWPRPEPPLAEFTRLDDGIFERTG
jgi:chemotaxis methyl-accepting protein methylase